MDNNVSIIIPTFNGGSILRECLEALSNQSFSGDIQLVVIDSGSSDGTVDLVEQFGAEIMIIDQKDFHHSRTRNKAVSKAKHPNIIFLVQDAIPISQYWLRDMVNSLCNNEVVAVYGQQVPHKDADLFARFEVDYHSKYLGDESLIQTIVSTEEFDKLTYENALRKVRFDNVCAIYSKEHLIENPFPDIAFGEDMAWAYDVMKKGYNVLYEPQIKVHHSHNRSPQYRFRRAIVNTVCCWEILGKTNQDLSYLDYKDLILITEKTNDLAKLMYAQVAEIYTKGNSSKAFSSYSLLKKMPFAKKFAWKLIRRLKSTKLNHSVIQSIIKSFEHHGHFILTYITEKYENYSTDQLYDVVDQMNASMLGGLLGEVYTSYRSKGKVPIDIENLIVSNSKGV
jgi:glycosyltransferase involved in cell wall biosynthesis